MTHTTPKRLVYSNVVSDVLVDGLPDDVRHKLDAMTHRELWTAGDGDVLACPGVVPDAFRAYVADTLGIRRADVVENVSDRDLPLCACDFARRADGGVFEPYALTHGALAAALAAGLRVAGYASPPSNALIDRVYELNTKSGFLRLAGRLSLPTAPGAVCADIRAVGDAFLALTAGGGEALLKFDRSASGYGHLRASWAADLTDRISRHVAGYGHLKPAFVVERFVEFCSTPSVELEVTDAGPQLVYLSDMICYGQKFSGLITPPSDMSATLVERIEDAGRRVGWELHRLGYRGPFDLDAGQTPDGQLLFHEVNVRKTGGTYLQSLVSRLPGSGGNSRVWRSDARSAAGGDTFEGGVETLRSAGLAYRSDRGEGAILTADTLATDRQWRYLVVARDHATAARMEQEVVERLTN